MKSSGLRGMPTSPDPGHVQPLATSHPAPGAEDTTQGQSLSSRSGGVGKQLVAIESGRQGMRHWVRPSKSSQGPWGAAAWTGGWWPGISKGLSHGSPSPPGTQAPVQA